MLNQLHSVELSDLFPRPTDVVDDGWREDVFSIEGHRFEGPWRYEPDCGCDCCQGWELWVSGLDHPGHGIDEQEWWEYHEEQKVS